jgi:hypothetical protein
MGAFQVVAARTKFLVALAAGLRARCIFAEMISIPVLVDSAPLVE